MKTSSEQTRLVRTWLFEQALPLWSDKGIDNKGGGFLEQLTMEGNSGLVDYKRTLVQARQIYVYSHAYLLEPDQRWIEAAAMGMDFMERRGWQTLTGGWRYSVTLDGGFVDDRIDLYTQAFVIYACAWYYSATKSELALALAEKTIRFIDRRLTHPLGGFQETDGNAQPRRQNPHMHLLEACLAMDKALRHVGVDNESWLTRASQLIDLASTRFIKGPLLEYFEDDWTPKTGTDQAVEPGHHYEWCWLLHEYANRPGVSEDQAQTARTHGLALYQFADKFGHRFDDGLAINEVAPDGAITNSAKRLWPQTEWIKANVALFELTGDPIYRTGADKAVERLFSCFIDDLGGCWHDQLDEAGGQITDYAPASSFYHIFLALSEYLRAFDS